MQTINKKGLTVKNARTGGFFMVELRGILRRLHRLRAALHCFAAQTRQNVYGRTPQDFSRPSVLP